MPENDPQKFLQSGSPRACKKALRTLFLKVDPWGGRMADARHINSSA